MGESFGQRVSRILSEKKEQNQQAALLEQEAQRKEAQLSQKRQAVFAKIRSSDAYKKAMKELQTSIKEAAREIHKHSASTTVESRFLFWTTVRTVRPPFSFEISQLEVWSDGNHQSNQPIIQLKVDLSRIHFGGSIYSSSYVNLAVNSTGEISYALGHYSYDIPFEDEYFPNLEKLLDHLAEIAAKLMMKEVEE